MIGMAIWCWQPKSHSNFWIRMAIYSGAVLTLQFSILLWSPTFFISPLAGSIFLACQAFFFWLLGLVGKRFFRFTIMHLLILMTCVAVFSAIILRNSDGHVWLAIPFAALLYMFAGAPFMATVTFWRVAIAVSFLNRTQGLTIAYPGPFDLRDLKWGIVSWIIGWLSTWKFAIDSMLDEYSKLPPSPPPGCFISAAAASGHPHLVGSHRSTSGQLVSMQMARCKFIELALKAIWPSAHAAIRKVYDFAGPKIANQCRKNIWMADCAFVVLKPVEWLAIAVQYAFRISNIQVRKLYEL